MYLLFYSIIKDHLNNIHNQFLKDPDQVASEHPFMHTLFSNDKLSKSDKVMIAMEIFLGNLFQLESNFSVLGFILFTGGIDTTATTTALAFNYLARNKRVQSLARAGAYSEDNTYLNACVKETLRMSPTAGAIGRILSHDVVIGGYSVPKNVRQIFLRNSYFQYRLQLSAIHQFRNNYFNSVLKVSNK